MRAILQAVRRPIPSRAQTQIRREQNVRSFLRFYSTTSRTCPSCSAPLQSPLPTCLLCSYIQPIPVETTYYDLLGIPEAQKSFKLDAKGLKHNFLVAQRVCHPDAWSGKGEKEQRIAVSQSSAINEAFRTLASPLQRAQYILTLQGLTPQESDKLLDEDFIMHVLEIMEEIEQAEGLNALRSVWERNDDDISNLHSTIESLVDKQKWPELQNAVVRLKYLDNIKDACKTKEEELLS